MAPSRTDGHERCAAKILSQPMSALGHKRTFGTVQLMSALSPKADINSVFCDVRFVPKRTHARQQKAVLFDHLVSRGEQRRRYVEAERLGSLEVDRHFELDWGLDGKLARFCAP